MISIIVAFDKNNLIGNRNKLPWKIKEDLQNFKKITKDHTVIMGRKTFESIGRPLPDRRNIILTKNKNYSKEGVEVFTSVEELLKILPKEEIFIIGGKEIYNQFLPKVDKLYISHILGEFSGDTYFPEIDYEKWEINKEEYFENFVFKIYKRKRIN